MELSSKTWASPARDRKATPAKFSTWAVGAAFLFCSLGAQPLAAAQPHITHVVIIWLKHPGNAAEQERLIRASNTFRRIRGVMRVEAGRGMPAQRAGIDQDFDVSVVITFKNRGALERFQQNPRHQMAVREVLRPLARRFIAYNAVVDEK